MFSFCPHCANPIAGYNHGDSEETDEWYCDLCGWENVGGFDKKFPKKDRIVEARKMAKVLIALNVDKLKNKYWIELTKDIVDWIANEPAINYRIFSRGLTKLVFEVRI
jgi:hypothetical protein